MADESLHDPGGEWQDQLVTAARDYVFDHMAEYASMTPEAQQWLANPDFETVLDSYMQGNGWSIEELEAMITSIQDIHISQHGHGIWVSFDFEFESEDGDYSGERGAKGSI